MVTIRTSVGRHEMVARSSGSGRPVVLLHGIPGSAAAWSAVADALRHDHQVVTPDLLGFGASSRTGAFEDLWVDRQADALAALLQEQDLRDVVLVAHDYGGPVASALLGRVPDRISALLLAACNVFPDTPIPFPLSGIFLPVVGPLWARLLFSPASLRMMLRAGVGRPRPQIDPGVHVGDADQARAIGRIFETALRELGPRYTRVRDALAACGLPCTVVWGSRDPFFPVAQAHRTAALLGDAPVVVLEGAGHFLPDERPAELVEAIEALAARSASGPGSAGDGAGPRDGRRPAAPEAGIPRVPFSPGG